jgi:hypothetical protein
MEGGVDRRMVEGVYVGRWAGCEKKKKAVVLE